MTDSIKEQILQHIMTALVGTTDVSTRIYRNRRELIARQETPALVVEGGNDIALTNTIAYTDWAAQVYVTVVKMGSDVAEQDVDPIKNDIHSRLMADRTLGELAHDIIPVTNNANTEAGDMSVFTLRMEYRVTYRTQIGDLTTSQT